MIQRLRFILLVAGLLVAGLSFAQEPPAQPDDPPVRLKKKHKADADKPPADKPDPAKPPMKEEKKAPPKKEDGKEEPAQTQPQEDEAEVLNRVAKNVRMAEEKIANKELGDNTRQLQEDILKDLDSLIQAAENPPQGGGGGGDDNNKQDQPNDPKSNMGKSGSMGQQSGGKQGSSAGPGNRSQRAQRRHQQGNGTQQANKGGQPKNGSGQPMPGMGMGEGNQGGKQQATAKTGGNNGGGGAMNDKKKDDPNNADLYKEAWGHLPAALRAEMMAYSNDKQFMAKYDELIKRYYRSIAEEGRNKGGN